MSTSPSTPSLSGLAIEFPALDNTLGAVLIGTGMSSILAGVSLHQIFRYFRRYPNDHWSGRAFVIALSMLDIVHEALIMHLCYYYMVSNYFRPGYLLSGVWSLRLVIPTTGLISVVSHIFFARRIVILAGNKHLVVPVAIIAAILISLEFAFCAATTFYLFRDVTFKRFVEHSSWLISASLGTRVLTDLITSGGMVAMLRRNRTGFKRTDSILDLLIMFSINTGLLTSIVNLASMITAVVLPNSLIYCGIYIFSSKLYSNSVIAVLNSRKSRNKHSAENQSAGTSWLEMNDRISAVGLSGTNAEVSVNSVLDISNMKMGGASSRAHLPAHDLDNLSADYAARRHQWKTDM